MEIRLDCIAFGVTGLPSFVIVLSALCDSCKSTVIKAVFFAKRTDTVCYVLGTIGGNGNNRFSLEYMGIFQLLAKFKGSFFAFINRWSACIGDTNSSASFRADNMSKSSKVHFVNGRRFVLFPLLRFCHPAFGFLGMFSSKIHDSQLFPMFRGKFHTRIRTGGKDNVKPSIAKRFEFVEPVLLTVCQKFWEENQFQYFKRESLFTVLIPSALQFDILVFCMSKTPSVFLKSMGKVDATANIESTIGRTGDAVDARCSRYGRGLVEMVQCGHSLRLPKGASLGFTRITSTVGADQKLPLHYTTSTRSQSSVMGDSVCQR